MNPDAADEYGAIADLYDLVPVYRDRGDVEFFVEAARESHGPVLEIGCGTGRVLIPTARAGIDIVGIDRSPAMLAICQRRMAQETPAVRARIRLVLADMRDFTVVESFRLVTLPFRPFQHLTTVEDQRACLQTIHRHLADNGRLILDIFNPHLGRIADESLVGQEFEEGPEFTAPDGRRVIRSYQFTARDVFNQINDVELAYNITHPDGRTEKLVHAFPMRYLFRFEAEHLLTSCGFRVENVYADYDRSPYGSKYPGELIFVASKR
jgi:SAM-dependent methyltransferase